jgi:hypothetical protein
MSTVINVHEAKTHLSRILEEVAAGAARHAARPLGADGDLVTVV